MPHVTTETVSDALYRWPVAARFGTRVPKEKFYEHGSITTLVRQRFVAEVRRITWSYKLAETTIHLPGTDMVPEIQVFSLETKGTDVSNDVLAAIDKSVHFPVIFEVVRGDAVRTTAAHKVLGASAPKIGTYFTTGWLSTASERAPLPTAIDLHALYEALVASLLPGPTRRGESVSEACDRMDRAKKLEREIAALDRKLRTEPQLNRKVELRRELRDRKAALAALD